MRRLFAIVFLMAIAAALSGFAHAGDRHTSPGNRHGTTPAPGPAPVPPPKPTAKAEAFAKAVAVSHAGAAAHADQAAAQTVTVGDDKAAASSAGSVFLTAGADSCAHSTGAGIQGMEFGVTFGSTWESSKCNTRQDARVLRELGAPTAAHARMCLDDDNRAAYEMAGIQCPPAPAWYTAARAPDPPAPVE